MWFILKTNYCKIKQNFTILIHTMFSASPYGKTKRIRWSSKEKRGIKSVFGKINTLDKLPSLEECRAAITKCPDLRERTPQQIKSWIHNQRKCE